LKLRKIPLIKDIHERESGRKGEGEKIKED